MHYLTVLITFLALSGVSTNHNPPSTENRWKLNVSRDGYNQSICVDPISKEINGVQEFPGAEDTKSPKIRVNWFTQLSSITRPLPKDLSATCRRDVEEYLQGLENMTEWAVQMMDSSAKMPSGILMGNLRVLGDFDECLSVEPPSNVKPQYCLSTIKFNTEKLRLNYPKVHDYLQKATCGRIGKEEVEFTGNWPLSMYSKIEWAVCVPASCGPKEVEDILAKAVENVYPDNGVKVSVEPKNCHDNRPSIEVSMRDWVFLSVSVSVIFLVIIGTWLDGSSEPDRRDATDSEGLGRFVKAFSLKKSWKGLTDLSSDSPGTIECLNGLRAISSFLIVLLHQMSMTSSLPLTNKSRIFNAYRNPSIRTIWNPFLIVDIFFVIGGLVRTQSMIANLGRGSFNYIKDCVKRYTNLTPLMVVAIGFQLVIINRLSTGPYRETYVVPHMRACEINWWKVLLHFINYADDESYKCIAHTWYTSADMHYYMLSPLLIYPLWKNPKAGLLLSIVVIIAAILLQFSILVTYDLVGLPFTFQTGNGEWKDHLEYYYYPSHTRATPYILGLLLGYCIYRYKQISLSKTQLAIGWGTFAAFIWWSIGRVYVIVRYDIEFNKWNHIIFGALNKTAWAMSTCWLIFVCHYGYARTLNRFLSSNFFKFHSRLGYCLFMFHLTVLFISMGNYRSPSTFHPFLSVSDKIGEHVVVLFFSLVMYLFIEAPFREIFSLLLQKRINPEKTIKQQ
ncbi:nose resistant to fluoxetine protein 6 isoform X1 [Orussus abietinus]|uniref:nose resistant to fluoxetine protein 6 isoform X1 n=1 Tax=Orussus abietinus TaxID=222816 RepID=UPI0006264781|nr:nose resistant to fluoxetine protein 6 isoform X1 [Orussus abietinus]